MTFNFTNHCNGNFLVNGAWDLKDYYLLKNLYFNYYYFIIIVYFFTYLYCHLRKKKKLFHHFILIRKVIILRAMKSSSSSLTSWLIILCRNFFIVFIVKFIKSFSKLPLIINSCVHYNKIFQIFFFVIEKIFKYLLVKN